MFTSGIACSQVPVPLGPFPVAGRPPERHTERRWEYHQPIAGIQNMISQAPANKQDPYYLGVSPSRISQHSNLQKKSKTLQAAVSLALV